MDMHSVGLGPRRVRTDPIGIGVAVGRGDADVFAQPGAVAGDADGLLADDWLLVQQVWRGPGRAPVFAVDVIAVRTVTASWFSKRSGGVL